MSTDPAIANNADTVDAQPQEQGQQPKITSDVRFRAARKLIESGRDGAIDMFALLLEESRAKHGEASIETAPAYFEYGVALFREAGRQKVLQHEEVEDDRKPSAVPAAPAAAAAEEEEGDDDEDDEQLAFSMMETAFAIYDQYVQLAKSSTAAHASYLKWAEREQLPRILSNIGDLLSSMGRHADAADAYTRELFFRDANLQFYDENDENGETSSLSLEELIDRRKTTEANILVATELLDCPPGQDVVTTETKTCLVKAEERESYATGYYEQARDQLQETVYLMAKLIAATPKDDAKAREAFQKEKENVCFASTLVMSVGEKLAFISEQKEEASSSSSREPAKKKAKR